MILAKRIFKLSLYMCLAIVLVLIVEGIYFYYVIQQDHVVTKADAIVVFNGFRERVEAGYKLAGQGYAPNLVVTAADSYHLSGYNRRYGLSETVNVIKEDKARTTFENAFYAEKIISENQFRSVILVTSRYHLPRSLLLFRAVLLGRDILVQIHTPPADREKLWSSAAGRRLINSEMFRFWGSLSELLYCKATGGVPEKHPKDFWLVRQLRSLF